MGTDQARFTFDALFFFFRQKIRDHHTSGANARKRKKEEETVKINKSKAEPVNSWCYPRQAGSIKIRQRVVWSLIFLVYGVCLVKAEVQEEQASHQQDLLWMKRNKKERKTARERTQYPRKK